MKRILTFALCLMGLGLGIGSLCVFLHWVLTKPSQTSSGCIESVVVKENESCDVGQKVLVIQHYGNPYKPGSYEYVNQLIICQCPPFSDPFQPYISPLDSGSSSTELDSGLLK